MGGVLERCLSSQPTRAPGSPIITIQNPELLSPELLNFDDDNVVDEQGVLEAKDQGVLEGNPKQDHVEPEGEGPDISESKGSNVVGEVDANQLNEEVMRLKEHQQNTTHIHHQHAQRMDILNEQILIQSEESRRVDEQLQKEVLGLRALVNKQEGVLRKNVNQLSMVQEQLVEVQRQQGAGPSTSAESHGPPHRSRWKSRVCVVM